MQRRDFDKLNLPDMPGVYTFLGPKRKIFYVGKATSLRDRVRSYFGSDLVNTRGERIVAMVERAKTLTWQETRSVLEALIIEANLIKKHQPPYNVDEKDDKSWNYVVITREDFPRIFLVRGRELAQKWDKRQIKYTFGPFPQGGSLKEAVKIVRKIFPFRDMCIPCEGKIRAAPAGTARPHCRPCFNRQLGLCPGVCSGEMSQAEYATTIKHIRQLFSGNMKGLKRTLAAEMKAAVKTEQFEKAAIFRRQIAALEHIRDVSLIKNEHRIVGGQTSNTNNRIEAFDAAHTAGVETVAVMTVVQDGEPVKSEYRKFTIRTAKNDDIAALREVLSRRLEHPEWPLPRLFVIDGGTAQVRAAERVLRGAGIEIPVVGVVKNDAHKPERLIGNKKIATMYERDILLANSEAHRFAIQWHRARLRTRSLK